MERINLSAQEFRQSAQPRHDATFSTATIHDAKLELNKIQLEQDRAGTLMNMNRMSLFLEGMTGFEGILLSIDPRADGMSVVWGCVLFFMKQKSAVSSDRAFNDLLHSYGFIGAHLPCQFPPPKVFEMFPELIECLSNIYEDIQRFNSMAYDLFSLRPKLWQSIHRPLWNESSNLFKQIARSLDSHAKILQYYRDETGVISDTNPRQNSNISQQRANIPRRFQLYQNELISNWGEFDRQESERKRAQKQEVIRWISATSKNKEIHQRCRGMRICPDTGCWLLHRYNVVLDWMRDEEAPHSAIWLHANTGFGKTILSSFLVDKLEAYKVEDGAGSIPKECKVYFFYCQEDDDKHRTYLDILKGILLQMVEQIDYLIPVCHDKLKHEGGDALTNTEAAQTLIRAFIQYKDRQYVIIDGIDGCDAADLQQVIKFFTDEAESCDNIVEHGHLRVLFTSRTMPGMERHMPEGEARVELKSSDNSDDIRSFVRRRIPEFSQPNDSRRGFNLSVADEQQIENSICHQSSDMFLCAFLLIEDLLHQPTKDKLLESIQKEMLPGALATIYERLVKSLESRMKCLPHGETRWEQAKLLLGWLVCARRPLRWHELQSIVCFDTENQVIDFDRKMLRHNVREYLGSLVHTLGTDHIQLVHSTARSHVINNHHIQQNAVQCHLASLCLRYLCLPCFVHDFDQEHRRDYGRRGWFAFQDYACSKWQHHVITVIEECGDFLRTTDNLHARDDFEAALRTFVATHGHDFEQEVHEDLNQVHVNKFDMFRLYSDLLPVWNQIYTHQNATLLNRDNVGIKQIDDALALNRSVLETFSPNDTAIQNDTIADYYGNNLFKCRRTWCELFYIGFDSKKAADDHNARHVRPYQCPSACSSASVGFSTKKDRDKHIRLYHPELHEGVSAFREISRQQSSQFTCRICGDGFTRKLNLDSHEKAHYGDRPFKCSKCDKAFTRKSDRNRHEKIHLRRGA